MLDVLSQPFTVSLGIKCIFQPALAFDQATQKFLLAWTGPDRSINVMFSDDGLVFGGRRQVQGPGSSAFAPALAGVNGTPVLAWTDANTGELKLMNGLDGDVFASGETSFAAPALVFLPQFVSEPLIIAWTGTNAERQLNVAFSEFDPKFPPFQHKTTLESQGSRAATSISGPSLAFKAAFEGGQLFMGWTGLPGGPDQDNHLNFISSDNFELFDSRVTFLPVSSVGPAIVDVTNTADGDLLFAWTDRQSLRINVAHSNDLPTIPA
jgi:hypothetical protein